MFCPECQKEGAKSRVTGGVSSSTLLNPLPPYWDEEGRRHNHDSNIITTHYGCSRGHRWVVKRRNPCPTCGDNWS